MNLILLHQFPQREHNQITKMFDEETHKDLRGATGAQINLTRCFKKDLHYFFPVR